LLGSKTDVYRDGSGADPGISERGGGGGETFIVTFKAKGGGGGLRPSTSGTSS